MTDTFFKNLGLTDIDTKVYLILVKFGLTSAFKISRKANLPRTTIYRILDHLKDFGLAEEIIDHKRKLVKPSSLDKLDFLVNAKISETSDLRVSLPEIKTQLATESANILPGTKVVFYRGLSGITQVLWNSLKAKAILSYSYLTLDDFLGKKVAKQYREIRAENAIKVRELLSSNDPYLTSKTLSYIKRSFLFKNCQFRYLPSAKININHQIMVYDDVLVFYHAYADEVFAIEIHNPLIAMLQKQIFEILWNLSQSPQAALKRN